MRPHPDRRPAPRRRLDARLLAALSCAVVLAGVATPAVAQQPPPPTTTVPAR